MHNSAIGGSALTGSAIGGSNGVGASMVSGDFGQQSEERLNVRVISFRNSNIEAEPFRKLGGLQKVLEKKESEELKEEDVAMFFDDDQE